LDRVSDELQNPELLKAFIVGRAQVRSALPLSARLTPSRSKHKSEAATKASSSTEAHVQTKRAGTDNQWKRNKKVLKRMQKDELAIQEANTTGHQRQAQLIAKAKLYEKLRWATRRSLPGVLLEKFHRKGDFAGLTEGQKAALNVDFDAKMQQDWDELDKDESSRLPQSESSSEEESDSDDDRPVSPALSSLKSTDLNCRSGMNL
jgi:hypothetical protein